jgi:hypothetical protein
MGNALGHYKTLRKEGGMPCDELVAAAKLDRTAFQSGQRF